MSSYFFHLKLELYPVAAKSSFIHTSAHPPTTSRRQNQRPVYLPPSTADIFKTPLPAHSVARNAYKRTPGTPNGTSTSSNSDTSSSPRRLLSSNSHLSDSQHGEALLLPERRSDQRQPLPPSPAQAPVKPSNELSALDWRYEAVSIESVDMELSQSVAGKAGGAKGATVGGLHTKAVYLPSDPKTTEVGWGVVHLYRDTEESAVLATSTANGVGSGRQSLDDKRLRPAAGQHEDFSMDDCTTLCILAVPSWMMPSDLLGFVGDTSTREDISHFRLIRTGRANKYMVLIKFRQAKRAREWQKQYNGRLFSAAEPENCHVVFIKSVSFLSPEDAEVEEAGAEKFPQNTHDPFTAAATVAGGMNKTRERSLTSSKPLAPPPPNLLELPTCPVCLERMDETTGLLTILCQHVFHCACLEKWRGSGCPVCRYTHSPSFTFPYPRPSLEDNEDDPETACAVCAKTENLWICLICGVVGCGRYDSAHAYKHYEETSHCYAMDTTTQHVWDYAGDGYVHRLIQSKPTASSYDTHASRVADESVTGRRDRDKERERHANEAFRSEGGDSVPREKMESMANEYTYLLTSQLEGQRRYFEEQVLRAGEKARVASSRAEKAAERAEAAVADLEAERLHKTDASVKLAELERRLDKAEKTKSRFETMARDLSASLREEKVMTEGLLKRINAADAKAEAARLEADAAREAKKELEEMNHDLTMFISSQEKVRELEAQGEEVAEGGSGVVQGKKKKGKGKK